MGVTRAVAATGARASAVGARFEGARSLNAQNAIRYAVASAVATHGRTSALVFMFVLVVAVVVVVLAVA